MLELRHKFADALLCFRPDAATSFDLGNESLVVQRLLSEARRGYLVPFTEGVDVMNESAHIAVNMLDISNRQGRIDPRYRFFQPSPEYEAKAKANADADKELLDSLTRDREKRRLEAIERKLQ